MTTVTNNNEVKDSCLSAIYEHIRDCSASWQFDTNTLAGMCELVEVEDSVEFIEKFGNTANVVLNIKAGVKLSPRDIYYFIKSDNLYEVLLYLNISPAYFVFSLIMYTFNMCMWLGEKDYSWFEYQVLSLDDSESFTDKCQDVFNHCLGELLSRLKKFYD